MEADNMSRSENSATHLTVYTATESVSDSTCSEHNMKGEKE